MNFLHLKSSPKIYQSRISFFYNKNLFYFQQPSDKALRLNRFLSAQRLQTRTMSTSISTKIKEVAPSIWKYNSFQPGPKVVILGGVHGNELCGIQVVEYLKDQIRSLERGQLVLALGSLEAIKINKRFFESDMNRCFNPDDIKRGLSQTPTYEEKRAQSIIPFVQEADLLIDLHATNKPSDAFTRIGGIELDDRHFKVLNKLGGCQKLLWDPRNLIGMGKPVCSDELPSYLNKVGICYETGFSEDITCFPRVLDSMLQILKSDLGLEMKKTCTLATDVTFKYGVETIYELQSVFVLGKDGFSWNANYGSHNFQLVPKGETIGFQGESPLVAKEDSYIIFPKVESLWKEGNPLGWLATIRT